MMHFAIYYRGGLGYPSGAIIHPKPGHRARAEPLGSSEDLGAATGKDAGEPPVEGAQRAAG